MKSSISIDLDDPRTAKIADVISNKTTKKILSLMAEKELSQTELSKTLGIPLNTIEYNIKKLEEAGLIEKTKDFFWSTKGKRIHRFKVSNKTIIISPKSLIRGVIPTIIITGILALIIKFFLSAQSTHVFQEQTALKDSVYAAGSTVEKSVNIPEAASSFLPAISSNQNTWLWFLLGAFSALLIFLVWNFIRNRQK